MSSAYSQAGVNIDAGNEAVNRIKQHTQRTMRPEVIGEIGGFGGLFALKEYKQPVLVSATDGVGTKLKIAFELGIYDTIGIDCVAMCVNDIIVQGAEPLFFLDYIATGQLDPERIERVVKGVADGCEQAGCALIGGETAEMPGFYSQGELDIAGFCVGAVERDEIIDGLNIVPGDVIIGLASSGLHSNGYSLIRKVICEQKINLKDHLESESLRPIGEVLLTPTRIYVKSLLALKDQFALKGAAHITGGGLTENIPRILPSNCQAELDPHSWDIPPIFHYIAKWGNVPLPDMYRTFNMGVGMAIIVSGLDADQVIEKANSLGEDAKIIGRIIEGNQGLTWRGGLL